MCQKHQLIYILWQQVTSIFLTINPALEKMRSVGVEVAAMEILFACLDNAAHSLTHSLLPLVAEIQPLTAEVQHGKRWPQQQSSNERSGGLAICYICGTTLARELDRAAFCSFGENLLFFQAI